MKIVLVGLGKAGKCIVEELSNEGHEIVCIDISSTIVENVIDNYDVMGVVGNGANVDILNEANIADADCLIAVTLYDEVNIMTCLTAKRLGVKNCVARIRNPEYLKQAEFMKNEFGINLAINPEKETADEIRKIIDFPSAGRVDTLVNDVEIVEYTVKEDSPIINKSLITIRKEHKVNILVVAVKRDEIIEIPTGNFKFKAGDIISILGERNEIVNFLTEINDLTEKSKNILIVGGGKTGYYLMKSLSKGRYNVKVIDNNKARCEELAAAFPKITVVHEDGTDSAVLLKEGLKKTDVIVCLTSLDESNFVTSMFAKENDVTKIITKINRDALAYSLDKEDYSTVISPKRVTANKVSAYLKELSNPYGNHVLGLTRFAEDNVEAVIFKATETCKFLDIKLKDIVFKPHYILGCIMRDNEIIIPSGSTTIKENDKVIVITNEKIFDDINEIVK